MYHLLFPPYLRSVEQSQSPSRRLKIEDPLNKRGWKLFFLLPKMILQRHSRRGKVETKEVKAIYNRFLQCHWEELIHLKRSLKDQLSITSGIEQGKNAAIKLVKCGELSRVSRILTSQHQLQKTDNKLKDKHPHHTTNQYVPEKLDNVQPDLTSPISLKRVLCSN